MRPNSLTLANSAGKGFTTIAATVSAVMEGIELHHAEQLNLPMWEATFASTLANPGHLRLADLPVPDTRCSIPICRCSGSRPSTSSGSARLPCRSIWSGWSHQHGVPAIQ